MIFDEFSKERIQISIVPDTLNHQYEINAVIDRILDFPHLGLLYSLWTAFFIYYLFLGKFVLFSATESNEFLPSIKDLDISFWNGKIPACMPKIVKLSKEIENTVNEKENIFAFSELEYVFLFSSF